jgi:hypothetical protein
LCAQSLPSNNRQSAKSLELRTAMSRNRLWQEHGKNAEAYWMLAESYGWFTDGFNTKDLQEDKALLEELAKPQANLEEREFDVMVGKENPVRYDSECYPHYLTEGVLLHGHRSAFLRHRRLLLTL